MKIIYPNEFYWFENDWRKQRQKGPFFYILLENGLIWGVVMSVFLTGWQYLDEFGWTLQKFDVNTLKDWGVALMIFTIGGAIFGAIRWFINEKRFKKYQSQNDHS